MATEFDWQTMFATNETPYFAMFSAGVQGIPIEECQRVCAERKIPLRPKDIQSWQDGNWKCNLSRQSSVLNPIMKPSSATRVPTLEMKLSEFKQWPAGWQGTEHRWFPCDENNMPLYRWGYLDGYTPTLHERESAIALSPIGWVGQNMYAQPFIVIDIDGVGHGETDEQVIEFGNRFRNETETWENPNKPGSFHLYFNTPYQIPISHFNYAKLDLMGNQKNAAVYTKDKQSNGIDRALFTEQHWEELKAYVLMRKAQRTARMEGR